MICLLAFVVGYWIGVTRPPLAVLSGGTEPPKRERRTERRRYYGNYYRCDEEAKAVAQAKRIMGLGDEG